MSAPRPAPGAFVAVPRDGGESCDPLAYFGVLGWGDCASAPKGVTTVDTTFAVPGPLIDPGCPLHGIGCSPHCPTLLAVKQVEADMAPKIAAFRAKLRAAVQPDPTLTTNRRGKA